MDLSPPREIARIIQVRQLHQLQMVIATCDATGRCWYEGASKISGFDVVGLVKYLKDNWPVREGKRVKIMFVCHNPMKALLELEKEFEDDPTWNVRIRVSEGETTEDEGCTFYRAEKTYVSFFGFRDTNRHTKYLYPVSPLEFMRSLDEYGEATDTETIKMYRFGGHLRRFLQENSLRFSSSRGGISAQLLRDGKFYPRPRRKVPRLTNESARAALPGNCYQITERQFDRFYQSVYIIDQQNAHHHAAETTVLPSADNLFAHGWYWNQSDDEWLPSHNSLFEETLKNEYGLFRVRVSIPRHLSGYIPPWCRASGNSVGGSTLANVWLYSNEIAFARSLGVEIRYISRWYSSPTDDVGLKHYAAWARNQVDSAPDQKPWLKPTLLSAYGILGAKPRYFESAYKRAEKGEDHTYVFRGQPFTYRQVKTNKKIQSPVANVIHRGMIEAETRKLSIQLARQLEHEDHNVIGIHADAILVENTGQQLPLLPPPWRVKDCLTRFRALDAVSFESDELEILPGRPRSSKRKRNRSKNQNEYVRQR